MATVYRGLLEGAFRVRRPVAVKVFDVLATEERDSIATALARAVRHAALVQHPNVAEIHDFALISNAQPVVISELVEGVSLAALLAALASAGRKMPTDIAIFVAHEIAEALEGAREARTIEGLAMHVVHQALSACDVLMSWHGVVKVTDFGLASAFRSAPIKKPADRLRRLSTLAPEVARGKRGDARSDVFSLGVLLREMLVGPRFPAGTSEGQAGIWAREGHVEGRLLDPQVPAPLGPIVARALELDPQHRYAHAGAMAFDLRRVCLSMGVGDGRIFLRSMLEDVCGVGRYASSDATQPTRHIPAELFVPPMESESRLAMPGSPESDPSAFASLTESGQRLAMRPLDSEPRLVAEPPAAPDHVTVHRIVRDG